ncbi:IS30 family transposase, partial [Streptococcus ictaluri]
EYVPKGVSLNPLTSEELDNYITAINERPRRLLQYQSSKFLFDLSRTA